MKKLFLKLVLVVIGSFIGITGSAQCPAITCPSNITVNNDAGNCGAIVNYTAPVGNDPCTTGSQTFNFTGGLQTWVVPVGVTSVTVDLYGAQGGGALGGNGGRAQGTIAVVPGQTLNIHVGGQPTTQLGPGGYNGGGSTTVLPCGPNTGNSFPGGGASDIRIGGNTLNDRVVVAGGGGGQGWTNGAGGLGGGTTGGDGAASWIAGTHGKGGTQSAGGLGGFYTGNSQSSPSGTFGVGGDSGPINTYCTGGAGGGGWYGGGAGYVSAGGGGSSYITGLTSASTTAGVRTGNGQVIISYAGVPVTTTQTAGLASGSTFPVGTTTNTFSATNGFGTVTCSFTVTVVDAENPTISCPGAITINTDAGQCTSTASIGTATGLDNCGTPTITNNAPSSFPIGNTTVTWTATDASNNSVTCTQVVTVVDVENPTISCPGAITINTDAGQCTSTASIGTATGLDNCGTPTITNNAPSNFPIGNTTVTWTATDGSGNIDTCHQIVTVVDAENPTIVCPTNITVSNDSGMCDAIVTYTAPVGTDNCTGVSTVLSSGLASGSTFPVGVSTITYVVTDAANNQDSCSFTVTVNDTTNPTVSCPANVTTCNPIVNNIGSTSSDNCTGETVSYTLSGATTGTGTGDASGTSFGVGLTTVTYTVTDASNNQDSCSFTVTVNPLPSVAIASFSPDTVCETDPAINLPVGTPASGTYSGNGVVGTTFDPNTAGVGVHYVVYSFTDSNSCTNMDSTMIVVESCVGIDENGTLTGVNIYPNPTSNNLTIDLGVLFTEVNLTLTSVEGKIVYQENSVTTSKVSVDMSNNSKGIYFLRVEANNKYKVYKIVKE